MSTDSKSRILELGSGPGFLAEHLLKTCPSIEYVALDFSPAMHELAIERLGLLANRVQFVERSFRDENWFAGLGKFQFVVTNQAIHELRHKSYAATLHRQVKSLLAPSGIYLICDHFYGKNGMTNDQLFMTIAEQRDALREGGFSNIIEELIKDSLVMHQAI